MTGEYFTHALGPSVTEYSLAVATIYRTVKYKLDAAGFAGIVRASKTVEVGPQNHPSSAMLLSYMTPTGTLQIRLAIGNAPTETQRAKTAEIGVAWLLIMHEANKDDPYDP